jgi:hypothetical protein
VTATYFINRKTGNGIYFVKGGKQDGKLWSVFHFDLNDIPGMLRKQDVKIITNLRK